MARNSRDKTSVCRNLMVEFERDENAEGNCKTEEEQRESADIENEVNKLLATDLNSKILKWNFDFVKETPLEGDWDWDFERNENNDSRPGVPGMPGMPGRNGRPRGNSGSDNDDGRRGNVKSINVHLR